MGQFVGADINGLVVQRYVVGKGIVVELMISAGKILIDEDLKTIIIPVLN